MRVRAGTARALVLLGAACSGAVGCSATPSAGHGVPARPPVYDIGPASRSQLRRGGVLRWPLPDFPQQWNYYQLNGAEGSVDDVLRAVLPYPMRTDPSGVTRPDPDYLTEVSVRPRDGGQVVTYTINPKAHWSDGTPITYRDFAAQAAALSGRRRGYQISQATGYTEISGVGRGKDDRQAVVAFPHPFSDWAGLFSPLYPAKAFGGPRVFNRGWLGRVPLSAGPFRPGRVDRSAKTITVVRDPGWWGRPAELDAIVFRTMDSAAMPGAFANGEIDLMDIGGDAGAYAQARQVRGAVVRRAGGPDWRQLTLNAASPVLSDVRVRQAVALGLDRQAIARSDLEGLDWPVRPLGNHFLVDTQPGYVDNSRSLGGYDPRRAERLLDQAGWVRHGAWRSRGGRPLVLRMVIPAGFSSARQEGELIQAMLGRIGIDARLQAVPEDGFFDRYIRTGDFDLSPFSWLGTPFPVSSNAPIFLSPDGGDLRENYARVGSARIDRLLADAERTLDRQAGVRLLNQADLLVWQEAAVIPLFQRPQLVAVRSRLANIGARGLVDLAYEDIGFRSAN